MRANIRVSSSSGCTFLQFNLTAPESGQPYFDDNLAFAIGSIFMAQFNL